MAFSFSDEVRRGSVQKGTRMESLKAGDKVRLKKLDSWVTSRDAAMTVKRVGEFPEKGITLGALCEWINAQGLSHERVYSLEELLPLAIDAARDSGDTEASGTDG
jgi:hypothetical protein